MPTKTTLKGLVALTAVAAFAMPAMAQDAEPMLEPQTDDYSTTVPATTEVSHFAAADINADGSLDIEEFKSLVVAKAGEGDADARALIIDGDYDTAFAEHDTDADGVLTETEAMAKAETMDEGGMDEFNN